MSLLLWILIGNICFKESLFKTKESLILDL